jgi:hypothetical protein
LTWTDARMRATARTRLPSGEESNAMAVGGVRSAADARDMASCPRG